MATAPTLASANIQYFNISGNDGFGAFSAHVAVDVVGGVAVSGSGFINGAGFGATESLTLITSATPNNGNYFGTVGWRGNDGTDFWGFDNAVPVTALGGLLFVANPSFSNGQPVWGTGLIFGFWNNGLTGYGSDYQAGLFGISDSNTGFYQYTGSLTAAAPEVSTWGMMLLGFAALGFAGYRRRNKDSADAVA
jgi:hypothetical protein